LIYEARVSLLQLLAAIFDLARIEAGDYDLREELVPIDDLIAVSLHAVRPLVASKSILITSTIETPSQLVAADPVRIKQALLNILTNVIKYTPTAESITIDTRRERVGDLVIAVTDARACPCRCGSVSPCCRTRHAGRAPPPRSAAPGRRILRCRSSNRRSGRWRRGVPRLTAATARTRTLAAGRNAPHISARSRHQGDGTL
jgi:hypothetical protein